jgi:hypothetical protein
LIIADPGFNSKVRAWYLTGHSTGIEPSSMASLLGARIDLLASGVEEDWGATGSPGIQLDATRISRRYQCIISPTGD